MNLCRALLAIISAASVCPIFGHMQGKSKAEIETEIDEFIEAVLECQEIPGLSLAVVRDGQPYLSKAYGVKDLETMEPLTNKTLLVIASLTKAFAATVVGLMIDDTNGTVTWDTPVRDVLGDWFYFHEGHRTERATIRDLLAHRMGIPGHNPIRIYGYTTRELMEKLRFLEFSQEWREIPQYNNLMYGLAQYVAETLALGTPWEDIARERLFTPLGMDTTTFVHQATDRWEDEFSKGYIIDEETNQLREVSLEVTKAYYDTISAPGAVSSNAEDMTKWLIMHLNDGQNAEGEQVVPPGVLKDTHVPVGVLPIAPATKPSYPVSYTFEKWGLGWMEGYYREFKRSTHSGSRDGYRSLLNLLPDLNIGVFTAINRENGESQDLIQMYIMDLLMGEDPWVSIEQACEGSDPGSEKQADQPLEKNHLKASDEDYVGVYGDYAYGNATVFINETSGLLSLAYGAAEWTLTESLVEERFSAEGLDPFWYWTMTVTFQRTDGIVTEMTLPFQTRADPTFVRGRDMSTAPPPPELCD